MTPSGNRRLNAALHRIAVTPIRLPGSQGKAQLRTKEGRRHVDRRSPTLAWNDALPASCSITCRPTSRPARRTCRPRLDSGETHVRLGVMTIARYKHEAVAGRDWAGGVAKDADDYSACASNMHEVCKHVRTCIRQA
ncbi:hypothetical protein [Nakamurella flavida]